MAKTTLSCALSQLGNNGQPQRHFVSGTESQALNIPQEVMDMIMAHFCLRIGDTWEAPDTQWWRLRLVCRTFELGIFPHFTEALSQHRLKFCFDDQSIDEISHLSTSRLAPFVRIVDFAGRRISPHVYTLTDLARIDPKRKAADLARWKKFHSITQKTAENVRNSLVLQTPPEPWLGRPAAGIQDNKFKILRKDELSFSRRRRTAFDARFPGSTATFELYSCSQISNLDLRTSQVHMQRLRTALRNFTKLEQIATATRCEVHGLAKNSVGQTVATTSFRAIHDHKTDTVRCVCGNRKCCLDAQTINWPAFIDLGRLNALLPSYLPLFTKLTRLSLDFGTQTIIPKASELAKRDCIINNVARFISRCKVIKCLWLDACETSNRVLSALAKTGVRFVHLETFGLYYYGGMDIQAPILEWLITHIPTLELLKFNTDITVLPDGKINIDLQAWKVFMNLLSESPRLNYSSVACAPHEVKELGKGFEIKTQSSDSAQQNEVLTKNFFEGLAVRVQNWNKASGTLRIWAERHSD